MKDILSTIIKSKKIQNLLRSYPEIIAGYLFGSRIKGKNSPTSDLDIGLICLDKQEVSPVKVISNLEKYFSDDIKPDITLVDLEDDPLLLIQIINGKLFYQKNIKDRLRLETRILHLYEDFQSLSKISKYYLEKSFKEGVYAH